MENPLKAAYIEPKGCIVPVRDDNSGILAQAGDAQALIRASRE
jgi:hypothetical protein